MAGLLLALAPVTASRRAAADDATPPTPAIISVEGTCPDEPVLDAAILALIPRGVAALPEGARVTLTDLAETYRVEVRSERATRTRLFRDAAHDCEQRARFAAVFIVLTLLPPELAVGAATPPPPPPTPPPASPPPPSPSPPPPQPPPSRLWRLEITALVDGAPAVADATSMLAWGGELRALRALGPVAVSVGVGFEPRSRFSVGGLQGREGRLPADVSLRVHRTAGGVELGGELGFAAAPFYAQGLNTAKPMSGTRLDLGARAGVALRLGRPEARVAPFVGAHVVLFPWPFELGVKPGAGLGTSPVLWLGARVGLSLSL